LEHRRDLLVPDDDTSKTDLVAVLGRDLNGHIVVENLDRQILALFAENLALFLLDDRPRTMVGIDHLVADLIHPTSPNRAIQMKTELFRHESRHASGRRPLISMVAETA